jgi:O-antigen ligase
MSKTGRLETAGRTLGFVAFPWAMFMYTKTFGIKAISAFSISNPDRIAEFIEILIFILFFLFLAATVAARWKAFLRFSASLGPIWALLLWAGISLLWSTHIKASLLGMIGMAGITGYGLMFSFYYRVEEQLRIIAIYLCAAILASLLLIWAFPSEGISSGAHEGTWKGMFPHKNHAGIYTAFGAFVFLLCLGVEKRRNLIYWAGFAACVIFLIHSRSLTGAVSALVVLASYAAIRSLRNPPGAIKRHYILLIWVAAGAIFFYFLFEYLDAILQTFGRDRTMSQRTMIWSVVLDKAALRPWYGYGLTAFWIGESGVSGEVATQLGWYPFHAHNGFLDLYLELGMVGVAIFLVCLARAIFAAGRKALKSPRLADSWHLSFLIFWITFNLSEASMFAPISIFWMFFVTATANLYGRPELERGDL